MKKKALIFDMDGVIFDSENCVFATWEEVAKENHLAIASSTRGEVVKNQTLLA